MLQYLPGSIRTTDFQFQGRPNGKVADYSDHFPVAPIQGDQMSLQKISPKTLPKTFFFKINE
jgi:hypothetical protein